jgi:hypothetical protein
MRIQKIAISAAAAALLGSMPVMAAASVRPAVAQLSAMPTAGTNLSGARFGSVRAKKASSLAPTAGVLIGVLAAAAVAGGVVAATDGGSNKGATDGMSP